MMPFALGLVILARGYDAYADVMGPASPPLAFWLVAGAPLAILQITEAIASSRRETRLAMLALSESVRRFDAIAAGAHDTILEVDSNERIVYVSPNFRDKLGCEPDDLVGTLAIDLVHPDESVRVGRDARRAGVLPPHRIRHA